MTVLRPDKRFQAVELRAAQVALALVPCLMLPGIQEFTLLPKLLLLQLALLAIAVAYVWRGGAFSGGDRLLTTGTAFLLVLGLSALWAFNPFRSTYDLSRHLTFFLFFVLLHHTLRRPQVHQFLMVSVLAGGLVSLLGIAEYLGVLPKWLPSTGRPSATFGFRNLAGFYLIANLPLSAAVFLISQKQSDRFLAGLAGALMFVFLLYTRARGSWVGLFCGTAVSLCICGIASHEGLWAALRASLGGRAWIPAACGLLLVLALGFLPAGFSERHVQRFDEKKSNVAVAVASIFSKGGDRSRFDLWRGTLKLVRDHPLLGVGLGNWEYVYPLYDDGRTIDPDHSPRRPHNDILWIWAEEGIPGLLAYLALIASMVAAVCRIWRSDRCRKDRLLALACSATVLSVVGAGCFSFPSERIPPSMLFWAALGLLLLLGRSRELPVLRDGRDTVWRRRAAILIPLLLLGCIWITCKRIGFDYYHLRAALAIKQDDGPSMLENGAKAIAYGPFDHQAFIAEGNGHLALGDYLAATRSYKRCLDYHPNFGNAYSNLALAEQNLGEMDKAEAYYRKALRLVANHNVARYNLGTLYQSKGQIDSAMVCYKESYGPQHTKPYVNLGSIYHQRGQLDSAMMVSERALQPGFESFEALITIGRVHADREEYGEAARTYTRFFAGYTGRDTTLMAAAKAELAQAYGGLGVQAEQDGRLAEAIAYHRTAIKNQPDSAHHYYNLGNVHRQMSAWDEAVEAYAKCLDRDSVYVDAYNNLGLTQADMGDFRRAATVYRKGLELAPDNAVIHYNLGKALAKLGKVSEAREAFNAFLTYWKGDSATLHYYMGEAYQDLGDTSSAVGAYRTFLARWQGDPEMTATVRERIRRLTSGGL
jgi:tetratricopeptide (TPR) repeat protein/O-antigen ligase